MVAWNKKSSQLCLARWIKTQLRVFHYRECQNLVFPWLALLTNIGCQWFHPLGIKKNPYLHILLKLLITLITGCINQLLLFFLFVFYSWCFVLYSLRIILWDWQFVTQYLLVLLKKRNIKKVLFGNSKTSRGWCIFEEFQQLPVYESWTEWPSPLAFQTWSTHWLQESKITEASIEK